MRDRSSTGLGVVIEIASFLVRRSKLTPFLRGDRQSLGFGAGVRVDLFFSCGPKMTCFSRGNRLIGSCVNGRNWVGFSMRVSNNLVLVRALR